MMILSDKISRRLIYTIFFLFSISTLFAQQKQKTTIQGTVKDDRGKPIEFATVYLKGERSGTQTDKKGNYYLSIPPGKHVLCVQFLGYESHVRPFKLESGERKKIAVILAEKRYNLQEVVIRSKPIVQRVNESAYNVVALDASSHYNSTIDLSDMLNKVSGIRIRKTGGVGSDMQVMLDGFSGKHVKVFIDGVPQEGTNGASLGLSNMPINYAERIEVYKGVVPVGFGTDAIGGVINIVTKKNRKKWHLDASLSYGSFKTYKSYVNFGQIFKSGFTYEVSALQNYSANNYFIDTYVKEFLSDNESSMDKSKIEHLKRFHDAYHNEALIGKIGVVEKKWADRLMFGFTYSRAYKDIQTGVRQEIVFGGKYRRGYSLMPSIEYKKKNLFIKGLDVTLTGNFNKTISHNVDTSYYEYNWRGQKRKMPSPGEQFCMHVKSDNKLWTGTMTIDYHINNEHSLTFNNVISSFSRSNMSLLTPNAEPDPILKETTKNISGLSYRWTPNSKLNLSLFGKHYYQFIAGPLATSSRLDEVVRVTKNISSNGYGSAGTFFILPNLQAKLSYEKVYRLPANEEMFGDEDMQTGELALKPEKSDNLNFNLSYNATVGHHSLYVEGGYIYRNIKDYIQRTIQKLSGGKYSAGYINYGKVLTKGYTVTARYDFSNRLSMGGTFTQINLRDNERLSINGTPNLAYRARIANIPYLFANSDVTFYCPDLGKKNNLLTMSYNNFYVKAFPLYSEAFGSSGRRIVPTQFSHNISISYSMKNGRYNVSFECRNLTNAKLYDNFSLQKASRAFYGKLRISL